MPLVNVMVNSRAYTIACDEGEQDHLKELAAHVDAKVSELLGVVGQVGDQKLLLMAAVLITDELFEARGKLDKVGEVSTVQAELDARASESEQIAADALDSAAEHLERIVAKLKAA